MEERIFLLTAPNRLEDIGITGLAPHIDGRLFEGSNETRESILQVPTEIKAIGIRVLIGFEDDNQLHSLVPLSNTDKKSEAMIGKSSPGIIPSG